MSTYTKVYLAEYASDNTTTDSRFGTVAVIDAGSSITVEYSDISVDAEDFTVTAWVKLSSEDCVITVNVDDFSLKLSATTLWLVIDDVTIASVDVTVTTDEWVHIAFAKEISTGTLYLNGVSVLESDSINDLTGAFSIDWHLSSSGDTVYGAYMTCYTYALSVTEVIADYYADTDTASSAFADNYPLNCTIVNDPDSSWAEYADNKLFIQDSDGSNNVTQLIEITNDSSNSITIAAGSGEASASNYHFEVRFRNATFSQSSTYPDFSVNDNGSWSIVRATSQNGDDGTWSVYLLYIGTSDLTLASGEALSFDFEYGTADGSLGERGTKVCLVYQNMTYSSSGDVVSGVRTKQVDILNLSSNNTYISELNSSISTVNSTVDSLESEADDIISLLEGTPQFNWSASLTGDGSNIDQFGYSVAISGDVAIVGAYYEDVNGTDDGAAYLFEKDDDGDWQQKYKCTVDSGDNIYLGKNVALSGTIGVISAQLMTVNGIANCGAAYIVEKDADTGEWSQTQITAGDSGGAYDYFGSAVAISGDTVVIGASADDTDGNSSEYNTGSVYIFEKGSNEWSAVTPTKLSIADVDNSAYDCFGNAVAIDGDTLVVGAYGVDSSGDSSVYTGAAFVFAKDSDGEWTQTAELTADDAADNDQFGCSAAVDDDIIVIGAKKVDVDDSSTEQNTGAAYVFEKNDDGEWTQTAQLLADDATAGDYFGNSVAISDEVIIVGAPYVEADDGKGNAGAAYVFSKQSDDSWAQSMKLISNAPVSSEYFGYSVAIEEDTVIVGAHTSDSAYIYTNESTNSVTKALRVLADNIAALDDEVDLRAEEVNELQQYIGKHFPLTIGWYATSGVVCNVSSDINFVLRNTSSSDVTFSDTAEFRFVIPYGDSATDLDSSSTVSSSGTDDSSLDTLSWTWEKDSNATDETWIFRLKPTSGDITITPDEELHFSITGCTPNSVSGSAIITVEYSGVDNYQDDQLTVLITKVSRDISQLVGSGNVGIGTTSPSALLHIYVETSSDDDIALGDTTKNGALLIGTETGNNIAIDSNEIMARNGESEALLSFQMHGGNIYCGGNVGIGTTAPEAPLHVNGGMRLEIGEGLEIFGEDGYYDDNQYHDARVFRMTDSNGTEVDGGITFEGCGVDGSGNDVIKKIFTIRGNGNVGIGTTSPQIDLAIGDTDTGLQQQGDGELAIYTNNVERVRIDSSGRVGIGTTSPSAPLHINTGFNSATLVDGYNGLLLIGDPDSYNIAIDNDEILARNNGANSTLKLQEDGGDVTINGSKPFILEKYTASGGYVTTSYSSTDYIACIAGFQSTEGDINENDSGKIMQMYPYTENGVWKVKCDFRSHNTHEGWDVWILFIRTAIATNNI